MLRLLSLLAGLGLFAASCGGSDDGDGTPTSAAASPSPSVATRDVTDEEYLAVICTGLDDFWFALNNARTVEEIRGTVTDFIDSLEVILPAPDVRPFHGDLLAYLNEAIDDPTQLATAVRPLPEKAVRDRLAEKELDVPECDDLTFFQERAEEGSGTPTLSGTPTGSG